MDTKIASQFTKVGLPPRDAQLLVALSKYRNQGGTQTRADALVRKAYELPDEGQTIVGDDVRQPDAEGRVDFADKASRAMPPAPSRDGKGQTRGALSQEAFARPVREPSKRQKAMDIKVKTQLRMRWMDTMEIPGRGPWRRLAIGSVRAIAKDRAVDSAIAARDSAIAIGCLAMIPPNTSTTKPLGEVISDEQFDSLVKSYSLAVSIDDAA